jgi:hypothetical protein
MKKNEKARGVLSTPAEPHKSLSEVEYYIYIEESDTPPVGPGVEVRSIKWVDIRLPAGPQTKALPKGEYVLTDQDGGQHLVRLDTGWDYREPFKG